MADAPALGYSIVANLGGDRQVTVQCFVASDETPAVINRNVDKALAVVDRLKARYELADLREEMSKLQKTYSQFQEDFARVEADYQASQKTIDDEIAKSQTLHDSEHQAGYDAFVASGRRGEYTPTGATKQRLTAVKAHIEKLAESRRTNEAEREKAVQNLQISIRRYEDEIARIGGKIAECEAKLED